MLRMKPVGRFLWAMVTEYVYLDCVEVFCHRKQVYSFSRQILAVWTEGHSIWQNQEIYVYSITEILDDVYSRESGQEIL